MARKWRVEARMTAFGQRWFARRTLVKGDDVQALNLEMRFDGWWNAYKYASTMAYVDRLNNK